MPLSPDLFRLGSVVSVLALLLFLGTGCEPEASPAPDGVVDGAAERDAAGAADDLPETNRYAIETSLGTLVVELSDETPAHRDNFKRLVAEAFYDSTTFHRVIEGFVIQGGDPTSRDDPENVGQGGPGYTVPAEFVPTLFHRRGALAAAREGDNVNPERRSSGSQFYIVQGRTLDDEALNTLEAQVQARLGDSTVVFADSVRAVYREEGGTPQLDQQYTVFGQLVDGFDVLDRIAATDTPRSTDQPAQGPLIDRPIEPIPMVIRPVP